METQAGIVGAGPAGYVGSAGELVASPAIAHLAAAGPSTSSTPRWPRSRIRCTGSRAWARA